MEVSNTFQIFANTFHSAAVRGRGYLITFWITYLNHTRKENWAYREAVYFYVFYIASLWWCIVRWRKKTHLIYGEGKHICLLIITFVLLGLCCEILQLNFSLKYYSNDTLNHCVFEPVSFGFVMGIATGKARFQTSHKMYVHESLMVISRWKDSPFTCDRKDCFCPMERTQNFVFSD